MARARQRLRKASLASHLRGLWLRRRLTRAGIVVVAPGRPGVRVVNHGTITVANVAFFPGVRLECWAGAHLSIGTGTYLNRNAEVIAAKEVRIGRDCMIGWDVVIMDTDQHGMAGAAQHVEDAVEDPAHVDGPWPPTGLRWREQGARMAHSRSLRSELG